MATVMPSTSTAAAMAIRAPRLMRPASGPSEPAAAPGLRPPPERGGMVAEGTFARVGWAGRGGIGGAGGRARAAAGAAAGGGPGGGGGGGGGGGPRPGGGGGPLFLGPLGPPPPLPAPPRPPP